MGRKRGGERSTGRGVTVGQGMRAGKEQDSNLICISLAPTSFKKALSSFPAFLGASCPHSEPLIPSFLACPQGLVPEHEQGT